MMVPLGISLDTPKLFKLLLLKPECQNDWRSDKSENKPKELDDYIADSWM